MNKQRVLILGAGISGLSLAWYLSRSPLPLDITILEKSERAGGWLHTEHTQGFLFEKGPRTFKVDKSLATVQLLHELALDLQIVSSSEKPHHRYLWLRDRLLRFPTNPLSFLFSPLTKGFVRAILTEWNKKVHYGDETVWDFVARRFNEDVARLFFDPMVIGIFGGDSRYISARSCFPMMKRWEEEYGSLTKGFWRAYKEKRGQSKFFSEIPDLPLSAIYTLREGMEQIPKTLVEKTPAQILYKTEVEAIRDLGSEMEVVAGDQVYRADVVFCALPAGRAGYLLKSLSPEHAETLSKVKSLSVTIINMGYHKQVLPLEGFGYLTSTHSCEEILGVVFDSSVFPKLNKSKEETRLTVKLGDRGLSRDAMIETALQGLKAHLGIDEKPDAISYKLAVHAIPQYGVGHLDVMAQFDRELKEKFPRLRFVGNYLNGISVDRCIARSKQVAEEWIAQESLICR